MVETKKPIDFKGVRQAIEDVDKLVRLAQKTMLVAQITIDSGHGGTTWESIEMFKRLSVEPYQVMGPSKTYRFDQLFRKLGEVIEKAAQEIEKHDGPSKTDGQLAIRNLRHVVQGVNSFFALMGNLDLIAHLDDTALALASLTTDEARAKRDARGQPMPLDSSLSTPELNLLRLAGRQIVDNALAPPDGTGGESSS